MTPGEFVKGFYTEYMLLLEEYFKADSRSEVAPMINDLHLDENKTVLLQRIISGALTDVFYTILLGIDGEASIGGKPVAYTLLDEDKNELTGGEIEAAAYHYFHGGKR